MAWKTSGLRDVGLNSKGHLQRSGNRQSFSRTRVRGEDHQREPLGFGTIQICNNSLGSPFCHPISLSPVFLSPAQRPHAVPARPLAAHITAYHGHDGDISRPSVTLSISVDGSLENPLDVLWARVSARNEGCCVTFFCTSMPVPYLHQWSTV
jgi:hypothetical protein